MIKRIFIFSLMLFLGYGCTHIFDSDSNRETVVVLTFDDAHRSIYETAFPLMQKYGFPATNYINTGILNTDDRLTVEELHILEDEGGWETGGHTIHHVNLPQIDIEEAEAEIAGGWKFLKDHNLKHRTFALPSGHANFEVIKIIKKYFDSIRGSEDFKMKYPVDRYSLGYYDTRNDDGSEKIIGRILRGITHHECVVIIGFHYILAEKELHSRAITPQEFEEILEFLHERKMKVMTVSEMLGEI